MGLTLSLSLAACRYQGRLPTFNMDVNGYAVCIMRTAAYDDLYQLAKVNGAGVRVAEGDFTETFLYTQQVHPRNLHDQHARHNS